MRYSSSTGLSALFAIYHCTGEHVLSLAVFCNIQTGLLTIGFLFALSIDLITKNIQSEVHAIYQPNKNVSRGDKQ